jgi:5-formyltetrahydrofolate cyclo-ligase
VAFDFQLFDRVPMGSQDLPVDMVITECGAHEAAS